MHRAPVLGTGGRRLQPFLPDQFLFLLACCLVGCAATPAPMRTFTEMELACTPDTCLDVEGLARFREAFELHAPSSAALRDQQHDREAFYTYADGTPWTGWDWLRYGLMLVGVIVLIVGILGLQDYYAGRR